MSKKRFENLPLRKRYRKQFDGRCEVKALFPSESLPDLRRVTPKPYCPELHVHHIFHPFQQRRDLWSNLIVIDSIVHQPWGHNSNKNELTVLCLYRKWEKSFKDAGEFDVDELHDCLGSCPIAWVERQIRCYPEDSKYFEYCLEIIESY